MEPEAPAGLATIRADVEQHPSLAGPKIATRSATTPKTDRLVCTDSILRDSSIPDHAHALLSYLRACGRRAPTRNEISRDVPCLDNDAITDAWKTIARLRLGYVDRTGRKNGVPNRLRRLSSRVRPSQGNPDNHLPLASARKIRGPSSLRRLRLAHFYHGEAHRRGGVFQVADETAARLLGWGNNPHTGKKIVGRERRRLLDEGVIVELRTAKRYGGAGIYGFADDLHGDSRAGSRSTRPALSEPAASATRRPSRSSLASPSTRRSSDSSQTRLPRPSSPSRPSTTRPKARASSSQPKTSSTGVPPRRCQHRHGLWEHDLRERRGTTGNAGGTRFGNDGGTAELLSLLSLSPRSRFGEDESSERMMRWLPETSRLCTEELFDRSEFPRDILASLAHFAEKFDLEQGHEQRRIVNETISAKMRRDAGRAALRSTPRDSRPYAAGSSPSPPTTSCTSASRPRARPPRPRRPGSCSETSLTGARCPTSRPRTRRLTSAPSTPPRRSPTQLDTQHEPTRETSSGGRSTVVEARHRPERSGA